MKKLAFLFTFNLIAALLFTVPVFSTGCATNTASATVKADKSVVAAANALLDAWSDHYVKQKRLYTKTMDGPKLLELEHQRAAVTDAWAKYQGAATTIVLAQRANYANVTNGVTSQVTGSISAAALPFMLLVNSLIK